MEVHYLGFNGWIQAVEQAGTAVVDEVLTTLYVTKITSLSGDEVEFLPNHYLSKAARIGQIQEDGSAAEVWRSEHTTSGDAWTDYLPESENTISDWQNL